MKKVFTLFAAAMIAASAFAQTEIAKYAEGTASVGTFTVGASDATKVVLDYSSKYNKNKTACTAMTFASSISVKSNVPTDFYVKATAEGGFKAGDVITFQPFTVMSATDYATTKYANIRIYAGDDTKVAQIFDTGSTEEARTVTDGHEEEGDVKAFTVTLDADCDALYFGRAGGTRINVLSFVVTRGGATGINAIEANAVASKAVKKVITKSGIVISKNGSLYNAAGQLMK